MVDPERVRLLAHQLWEQRGRPGGQDVEHWLEAERQLHQEPPETTIAAAPASIPKEVKRARAGKAKKKG